MGVVRPKDPFFLGARLEGAQIATIAAVLNRNKALRSLVFASALVGALALGACNSDDSLNKGGTGGQPSGQAGASGQAGGAGGGQAGSSPGGRAGTGGQAGSTGGFTKVPVTIQRVPLTAVGTAVYFKLDLSFTGDSSNEAAGVAIATDGAPWFAAANQLLRVAPDDTVGAVTLLPEGEGGGGGLVSDGQGAILMVIGGSFSDVGRFDTVTHDLATPQLPNALARPSGVASDGHGGFWVTGGNQPAVGSVDGTLQVSVLAVDNTPVPMTPPTAGVVVASDGQIFVSDYWQGRIGRVVGSGFVWTDLGGDTNAPTGLAADNDGSIWFVSLGKPNEVGHVAPDGTFQAYPLPASATPTSDKSGSTIARAPDGSFWFALPERAQLGRVTADGQLTFIQLLDQTLPIDLAFDASGRLWFTMATGFGRIEF
jgi:virginiamycin B lyase